MHLRWFRRPIVWQILKEMLRKTTKECIKCILEARNVLSVVKNLVLMDIHQY